MFRTNRTARLLAATAASAVLLAACADDPAPVDEPVEDVESDEPEAMEEEPEEDVDDADESDEMDHDAMDVEVTAETLRASLNRLLQEHVYLAGFATGEFLSGNEAGFEAAATELTQSNTGELADLVGSVYGDDVREQFFGFWNSHIDMFVDYTVALDAGDEEGQQDAVDRLLGYAEELAMTFETLTEGELPAEATQPEIEMHITTLAAAVDAQAAGDADAAFTNLREAAHHMDGMAEALAGAIAAQHGIEGDASSDLAGVRSELNALLQEHVYLAGAFTGQALSGGDSVEAAQNALLAGNTEDLADLVDAVYGDRIERDDFVQFWNSHILMFVAYTEGVAEGDQEAQDAAVADLQAYGAELAQVFEDLTLGELPADASTPLIVEHVTTLLPAIDAQGEGDAAAAYENLREAARHMEGIAFPLFDATVASL
ncbi:MAG: hypothetical protein JJT89_16195 [Nitriliruptoraceae bacterium]|nr:hypothetical protein [Nitriliruptoraceae bacterium]